MKMFDRIVELFKRIFSKNKYKELEEKNEIIEDVAEEVTDSPIDIEEDSKKLFHSFKVSTEVLELALEYEKKKKDVEAKEKEIEMLDTEIISLSKRLEKKSN